MYNLLIYIFLMVPHLTKGMVASQSFVAAEDGTGEDKKD